MDFFASLLKHDSVWVSAITSQVSNTKYASFQEQQIRQLTKNI
jgi:hypothetical protein